MARASKVKVTKSSGNVFADLGVGEPDEALAKSELAALIARQLRARRLTQVAAAALLGIDQPKVSELMRGRQTRFSTERLVTLLTRLGSDVEIVVHEPSTAGRSRTGTLGVRTVGARRPRSREAASVTKV